MIDPATLAPLMRILKEHGFTSTEEKLLGVILANVEQIQQCDIIRGLELHDQHCRDILERFEQEKLLSTFGKRAIFYRPSVRLINPPSVAQPSPSVVQPSPSVAQPSPSVVQPSPSVVQPSPSVVQPSPSVPPVSPETHNVKLTEPNVTNIKGQISGEEGAHAPVQSKPADSAPTGSTNPEISFSLTTQAMVPTAPGGETADGRLQTAAESTSNSSLQAHQSPETGQHSEKNLSDTESTPQPEKPAESLYSLLSDPKKTSEVLRRNRKKLADEKQQTLFRIIGEKGNKDGSLFLTDDPTDSLYLMIATMQGKTAPDPMFVQEYDDRGMPTKQCPMIPMYDAFVKYVHKLWDAVLPIADKPVYDYVLHRAAYIFVTELHRKTAVSWKCPETFVEYALRNKKKSTLGGSMIGKLRDVFEYHGLGWDTMVLKNESTYRAEIEHIAYCRAMGERAEMRDALFPSYFWSRTLLTNVAAKRKRKADERKAETVCAAENTERQAEEKRRRVEAEVAQKQQAERKEWEQYQDLLVKLQSMTAKERAKEFDKYSPEMLKPTLERMSAEQRDQLINLMTSAQRKRHGVKTAEQELEATMKKNLGWGKTFKPIK